MIGNVSYSFCQLCDKQYKRAYRGWEGVARENLAAWGLAPPYSRGRSGPSAKLPLLDLMNAQNWLGVYQTMWVYTGARPKEFGP